MRPVSQRSGAFTVASTSASASMRRSDSSSRSITVAPSPCHSFTADSTTNSTPRRLSRSRSGQSAEVRTISRPTNGSGVTMVTAWPAFGEMPRGAAATPGAGVVEHDDPVSGPRRAAHDVLHRVDVRAVDTGKPVDGGQTTLPSVARPAASRSRAPRRRLRTPPTSSGSTSVLRRTTTWRFVSWRSYQSRRSRICARRGCIPASRN